MKTKFLFVVIITLGLVALLPAFVTAQKTSHTTNKTQLSAADRLFVQDAINRNNEAMALAQTGLQQSKTKDVQLIARQFLNDHRAAQKKLYAIAHLTDTIPYGHSANQTIAGMGKLPQTDNLNSRRNRTITSITPDKTATANTATTANVNNTGNTVAGTANTQQRAPGFDTTSRFGVNQTFNNNTSIDNANGVNNANRTDVGSYSGRHSETNTVGYTQNPTVPGTIPQTNGTVNNISTAPAGNTANTVNNTPNFPNRVTDTVRQTGSSAGFQNPGTNLSFPANDRYAKTTPATAPNSNAGSDYGVASGTTINNAQTNALNTAPYSSNDINSNSVQTGRVLPTSDPVAVINSSTASMSNKDVGFNNANTNNNGAVQQNGQLAADNANGVNRRTSEVINNNNTSTNNTTAQNKITTNTTANTNNGAVLAGRTRGSRTTNNAAMQGNLPIANTPGNATNGKTFYTEPFAATEAMNALRTTTPDSFDAQWATLMNNNQQAAVTLYQTAMRGTVNAQVKAYINTVLPLLRGHQYAIKQWQVKQ